MPRISRKEKLKKDLDEARARLDLLRTEKRIQMEQSDPSRVYGARAYDGASRVSRALRTWMPFHGDADDELPELPIIRSRSRDLYRNNTVAAGAVKTTVSNVIGSGLKLNATVDNRILGWSDEKTAEWEKEVESLWKMWIPNADAQRRLDFYELQELAFLQCLLGGDAIAVLPRKRYSDSPFSFKVNLIESERLSNPQHMMDTDTLISGIQHGPSGEPLTYYFRESIGFSDKWKMVPAYGSRSGRKNVIHVFRAERANQKRGTPFLASVLSTLKQLGRYQESELAAAVVSSMFTIFIKSQTNELMDGMDPNGYEGRADYVDDDGAYEMAPGAIHRLNPDESIDIANPGRPNQAFEAFVQALMRQVGMALEIPYELLIKQYESSYSASRGARIDAARGWNAKRAWFNRKFNQSIYEQWMADCVAEGLLEAPGFFDDHRLRHAYTRASWFGDSMGLLDPLKETQAAKLQVDELFASRTEVTGSLNGGDFEANVGIQQKEVAQMRSAGVGPVQMDLFSGADPEPIQEGDDQ